MSESGDPGASLGPLSDYIGMSNAEFIEALDRALMYAEAGVY